MRRGYIDFQFSGKVFLEDPLKLSAIAELSLPGENFPEYSEVESDKSSRGSFKVGNLK